MTRRATLLALAARVEAAQGVDRGLDGEIWCAINGYTHVMWDGAGVVFRQADNSIGHQPADRIRPVTASFDAAASLVRMTQGFIAALGDIAADGLPGCCICVSTDPVIEVWGVSIGGGDNPDGRLARAMTAAALRAMAEEAGDE
jgi:hypothetical protein